MPEHYLERMKRTRMHQILAAIDQAKPPIKLIALKQECYEKLGMAPSLTMKYLRELEELGKIKVDEVSNEIVKIE